MGGFRWVPSLSPLKRSVCLLSRTTSLSLMFTPNLTLQSMASVRLTGGERDSLLLAFKNAKLSLVEYR